MSLIQKLASLSFKKLFLIDAIGALASAFMLGFVLVKFEPYFGMPKNILYFLAVIPIILFPYSLTCYYRLNNNWKPFLKGVAIVNLLYCCVTAFLICKFYSELTAIGICYFVLEILIIISLATVELKKASK